MTGAPVGGSPPLLVLAGIGNTYRRDDAVGVVVAEQVAGLLDGARDVGPVVDALDLLGRWDGADLAVVVDAVRSGVSPGTIRFIDLAAPEASVEDRRPRDDDPAAAPSPDPRAGDPPDGTPPSPARPRAAPPMPTHESPARRQDGAGRNGTSTHGIGLAGALRLARSVGAAPARVLVVGIEGEDFTMGTGLTPAVARAVPEAVRQVLRAIEEVGGCA